MITKKEMVVQSNDIVEASYRLSLIEQRIILYAIYLRREIGQETANTNQKSIWEYTPVYIDVKSFCKRFPDMDESNAYGQLKDAAKMLYSRSIGFIDKTKKGNERITDYRWTFQSSYVKKEAYIEIDFTPRVIEHITRLEKEFTSYDLVKVSRISSAHAVRIFQMLTQYKDIGRREISLNDLREMLMIGDDEYTLTANFVARVIDPAVKQINAHTDIKVSYEPVKTSRAITGFIFKIKDKTKAKPEDSEPKPKAEPKPKKRQDNHTRDIDFDPNMEF